VARAPLATAPAGRRPDASLGTVAALRRASQNLNAVIRQALKEHGLVDSLEVTHPILVNRDLTRSQRGHARNYEVGNVVRFTRGSGGWR